MALIKALGALARQRLTLSSAVVRGALTKTSRAYVACHQHHQHGMRGLGRWTEGMGAVREALGVRAPFAARTLRGFATGAGKSQLQALGGRTFGGGGPKGLPSNALRLGHRQTTTTVRRTLASAARSAAESVSGAAFTAGMSASSRKWVGSWLGLCTAWVFSMVVIGGITRLTRSGLSMTEWRFAGERPPLTEGDWEVEFEKYKKSPEFKKVNLGMTLDEFKFIYWTEYGHRMWGRVLGLVFALPFAYFLSTRQVSSPLGRRLGLLFSLGGAQGLVGWWMVKSGLEDPAGVHETPRVSPYRLAAHLTSAFVIYSGLLWTTLQVLVPKTPMEAAQEANLAAMVKNGRRIRGHLGLFGALVSLTAISGAFVAGLDAGHAYNTFPLMGDPRRVFPEDYWLGWETPAWVDSGTESWATRMVRNTFENTCAAQFHHRVLALTTLASVTALFVAHRTKALPRGAKALLCGLAAMGWCQVGLGVSTLLNYVPVHLGSMHQAGALTLMSLTIASIYCTKPLKAASLAKRLAARAKPTNASVVSLNM